MSGNLTVTRPGWERDGRHGNAGKVTVARVRARRAAALGAAAEASPPGLRHDRVAADAFAPLPGTVPVPLLQRTGCCWPVDGPGGAVAGAGDSSPHPGAARHPSPSGGEGKGVGQLFCDAPRESGGSYCAVHRARAWGPGTPSDQAAVGVALKAARLGGAR